MMKIKLHEMSVVARRNVGQTRIGLLLTMALYITGNAYSVDLVNMENWDYRIKSFCGFTFGSPYKEYSSLTNKCIDLDQKSCLLQSSINHARESRQGMRARSKVVVALERPFRYYTQAELTYTYYEKKLYEVEIIGRIEKRLTNQSLLDECNAVRKILERQGLCFARGSNILRAKRLFIRPDNNEELTTLPFICHSDHFRVKIDAFVDNEGTTFLISAVDLQGQRDDAQRESITKKDLLIDTQLDIDRELFLFSKIYSTNNKQIVTRDFRRLPPFQSPEYLLEPPIEFTNAVERVKRNDFSGYYSLALHFAKGGPVNRNYPYSSCLLEYAMSNGYPNAEFLYAIIRIGNSNFLRKNSRARIGLDYGNRAVSEINSKLDRLFKLYSGLSCATTCFDEIKGVELSNEEEVAHLRLTLQKFGKCSPQRNVMALEMLNMLDRIVQEKKNRDKYIMEVELRSKNKQEELKKNEMLVVSALSEIDGPKRLRKLWTQQRDEQENNKQTLRELREQLIELRSK